MNILFLGTGTSTGVPTIGCSCSTCMSQDSKNKRLRASIVVSSGCHNILIDTTPDLRTQALQYNINHIDAVLFTHHHADHLHGIDDLRSYNALTNRAMPCYGSAETIKNIHIKFSYIFTETQMGGGKPQLETNILKKSMDLYGIHITPVDIMHGDMHITAYRFNNCAYLTDCSAIPEMSRRLLGDLELLILGALRFDPHPTHFSVEEALRVIEELCPRQALFTHINHNIEHSRLNSMLPKGVKLAYDGMFISGLM